MSGIASKYAHSLKSKLTTCPGIGIRVAFQNKSTPMPSIHEHALRYPSYLLALEGCEVLRS